MTIPTSSESALEERIVAAYDNLKLQKNLIGQLTDSKGNIVDTLDPTCPASQVEKRQLVRIILEAIETLPNRESLVFSMYYEEELNLREIGGILGLSESRVCQIHGQLLVRLRNIISSIHEEIN